MSLHASRVKFTYGDYLLFPDDGKRHELIDGDHYVTPSPATKHQRISRNLLGLFYAYLQRTKVGEILSAPMDVKLSELDIVQLDLLYISSARSSIMTESNIQGAPDLVVEILSEGSRRTDEIIKRKLYERFGVQEYWVIDPELESVKLYRLSGDGYVRAAEPARENQDILTTPILPAFQVTLAQVFD